MDTTYLESLSDTDLSTLETVLTESFLVSMRSGTISGDEQAAIDTVNDLIKNAPPLPTKIRLYRVYGTDARFSKGVSDSLTEKAFLVGVTQQPELKDGETIFGFDVPSDTHALQLSEGTYVLDQGQQLSYYPTAGVQILKAVLGSSLTASMVPVMKLLPSAADMNTCHNPLLGFKHMCWGRPCGGGRQGGPAVDKTTESKTSPDKKKPERTRKEKLIHVAKIAAVVAAVAIVALVAYKQIQAAQTNPDGTPKAPKSKVEKAPKDSGKSALQDAVSAIQHMSMAEREAVRDYTGPNYTEINDALRKPGSSDDTPRARGKIAVLDRAFKSGSVSAKGETVYRGIGLQQDRTGKELLNGKPLEIGHVLHDPGYLSTSTAKSEAEHFMARSTYGQKGAILEIKTTSHHRALAGKRDESELVFNRGTGVRITGTRIEGDHTVYEAEMV